MPSLRHILQVSPSGGDLSTAVVGGTPKSWIGRDESASKPAEDSGAVAMMRQGFKREREWREARWRRGEYTVDWRIYEASDVIAAPGSEQHRAVQRK